MNATTSTNLAGTRHATQAVLSLPPVIEHLPTRCRQAAGSGDLSMPDRSVWTAGAPGPA